MFRLRASSLKSIRVCGGYATATKRGSTSNPNTRNGTLAHLWMDDWATKGKAYANSQWEKHIEEVSKTVTEEDEEVFSNNTNLILAECQEFASVYTRDSFANRTFRCENPLEMQFPGALLTGTADVIFINDNSVDVIDWKYYKDPSWLDPIETNIQLWAYLLMACKKFKKPCGSVAIGLIRQKDIWKAEFGPIDMLRIENEIRELVASAVERQDEYNFGPHCSNCLASKHCPEYRRQAFFLTHDIEPWDENEPCTDDEALRLALAVRALEDRLKTVKAFLKERVDKFGPIADNKTGKVYKSVTRKRKYIKDARSTLELLGRHIGKRSLDAASVTPKSLKETMMDSGMKPADREEFMATLQEERLLKEGSYSYLAWRKK
jgi:hypothetical protein